jgi:hypothetical protein
VLAALGHEHLALARGELRIGLKTAGELVLGGPRLQPAIGMLQAAGQEVRKQLAATHQVLKAAVRLQLQRLLQGAEPARVGFGQP